jgi:colanic acid biosynthesis glycosyl transferase WcaI
MIAFLPSSGRTPVGRPTLLLISQVYIPDPASVGQHLHDLAAEMATRGYRVCVLTSARGYDNPEIRFPRREVLDGVEIERLPFSSFGKRSILTRLAGQLSFLVQSFVRGLWMRRPAAILVSTSPPMCSAVAGPLSVVRRMPMVYWVMDINPDQAVAMGAVAQHSPLVRAFEALNYAVLGRAHTVVTLDRFMAARLNAKREVSARMAVFPPWPHDDQLELIPHHQNPFREEHCLQGKFVVMYSGNHSPANPLDTVLRAARAVEQRDNIRFLFVGGGKGKREVEQAIDAGAKNILSLPYQPISQMKYSLSAADVHLVTLGNQGVGIVHPCKIYGAMAVARPILAVSPRPSHLCDLLDRCDFGRHVEHGDVEGTVRAITELAALPPAAREAMGRRGRQLIQHELSKATLCARMADLVEGAILGLPAREVLLPMPQEAESRPARKAA